MCSLNVYKRMGQRPFKEGCVSENKNQGTSSRKGNPLGAGKAFVRKKGLESPDRTGGASGSGTQRRAHGTGPEGGTGTGTALSELPGHGFCALAHCRRRQGLV